MFFEVLGVCVQREVELQFLGQRLGDSQFYLGDLWLYVLGIGLENVVWCLGMNEWEMVFVFLEGGYLKVLQVLREFCQMIEWGGRFVGF